MRSGNKRKKKLLVSIMEENIQLEFDMEIIIVIADSIKTFSQQVLPISVLNALKASKNICVK